MVFDILDGNSYGEQTENYDLDNYKCEFWDGLEYPWLYAQESTCGSHCTDLRRRLFSVEICDRCDDETDHAASTSSIVFALYFTFVALIFIQN
eukprot:UN11746